MASCLGGKGGPALAEAGEREGGSRLMPTYITLMNWTDQGVRTAKETVHRREQADALAEKYGASIEQVYWTLQRVASILTRPQVDVTPASQANLSSRSRTCIIQWVMFTETRCQACGANRLYSARPMRCLP